MEYTVKITTAAGFTADKALGLVDRIVYENGKKLIIDMVFYYDAKAQADKRSPVHRRTHEFDLSAEDREALFSLADKYLRGAATLD